MTKMAGQGKKSLKNAGRKQLVVKTHFETIPEEQISETLNMLASIIYDHMERNSKNE